tara:strand:- start:2282 stop:2764 length:483 start_codon:yes stop_codon:yes gene_type:complete
MDTMQKGNENVVKNVTSSKILPMYHEAKEWNSTMEFYSDSLLGLKNILDRYLDEILQHENLDEIRECAMLLQDLRYTSGLLLEEIKSHLGELAEFQDKEKEATPLLAKEHLELKKKLAVFQDDFKEIKKEIFSITEHAIEISKEEKLAVELEKIKVARNR